MVQNHLPHFRATCGLPCWKLKCSFSIFVHELSRHLLGLYRYVTEMNILLAKKSTMGMQENHRSLERDVYLKRIGGTWKNAPDGAGTKREVPVSEHLKEDS